MIGSVMSGVADLSLVPKTVTGERRVAESLGRRYRTPLGHLAHHPNYGLDVLDRLQDTMGAKEINDLRAEMHAEALKDSRVKTAFVEATYSIATKTLSARVRAYGSRSLIADLTLTATNGTLDIAIA